MVLHPPSFSWRFRVTATFLSGLCAASGCSGDGDPWGEASASGGALVSTSSGGKSSGGTPNGASGGGAPRHVEGEGPAPGGVDEPTVVVHAGQDKPEVTPYEPLCPTNALAPPLTAADCPAVPPGVGNCKNEGQECLYLQSDETCIERWECRFGIWSPRGEECPSSETKLDDEDGACPELEPFHLAPCDVPELRCGYADCGYVVAASIDAVCSCGRWQVTQWGCPTIP